MDENVVSGNEPVAPEPTQTPDVVVNPVEQHARSLGWKPKEEFEGNPDEWRSAREFVERGEMIGKLRAQDRQIRQLEEGIKHIATQNQRAYANGYDNAIKELKVQRREAIAEGDAVKADELEQRIEEVKEEKQRAVQLAGQPIKHTQAPTPEFQQWIVHNPWYEIDEMAAWADAAAKKYVKAKGNDVNHVEVLDYIHNKVRQEFPEKFTQPKKNTAAPNPDGDGRGNHRGGNTQTQRFSKIKSTMSEDELRIMRTIIRTAGMTEEEYLKQYSEAR